MTSRPVEAHADAGSRMQNGGQLGGMKPRPWSWDNAGISDAANWGFLCGRSGPRPFAHNTVGVKIIAACQTATKTQTVAGLAMKGR
jgi:hypothetical protein